GHGGRSTPTAWKGSTKRPVSTTARAVKTVSIERKLWSRLFDTSMARRTTFCPVSENLSVIEPNSIMAPHSCVAKYSRGSLYIHLSAPHIRVRVECAQSDDMRFLVR